MSPTIECTLIGTLEPSCSLRASKKNPSVLVPQPAPDHGRPDTDGLLEEGRLEVLVGRVGLGQRGRDAEHRQAVGEHPRGRVGLLQLGAGRDVRAIERTDVVQSQEPAREDVVAFLVLAVHPPREVQQQLVEDPLEERGVAAPIDVPDHQRGDRMDRRVHVVERPLVGRQRAVRMLEPLATEQEQLVLRERRVDVSEGDGVERQVPGGEPRVLPGVGHRHDVGRLEVPPVRVAPGVASCRRRRQPRVAVEPAGHVVAVVLLAPQHPGEGLAHDQGFLVGRRRRGGGPRRTRRPPALGGPSSSRSRGRARRSRLGLASPAAVWCSRSRISADPPAATVTWYQAAAFVPVRSGLTVGAPPTT